MNCSATLPRMVVHALLPLACVHTVAWGETLAELDDAAARMQYAFYTGDAQALEGLVQEVSTYELEGPLAAMKSYQLAYGHWKLSQLYLQPVSGERPRGEARSLASKAAQACVQHARAAVEQDERMAEAHAIEAVCAGLSPAARNGTSGCARSRALRAALAIEPENPRVKLIEALCSSSASQDPAAVERWREVVESFEAAPPSRPGRPDWGHVEALTMLGEAYLQRGEPVAARDALERALVLAPDYRQAQQLLQTAAARPR